MRRLIILVLLFAAVLLAVGGCGSSERKRFGNLHQM
jgi:hypothetical protein